MSDCCHHHAPEREISPPATPEPSGALYTCPMHPEVLSKQARDCPKCGMPLEPLIPTGEEEQESRQLARRFRLSVILGIPVVILAMAPMAGLHPMAARWTGWLELALSLPVVVWCGAPIWQKGIRSLLSWQLNMFSLITLGTAAAFFDSIVLLLQQPAASHGNHGTDLYFEAATVIMVLVLMGQWLESRGRAKAGTALRELLDLTPAKALLVLEGTADREIPVAELQVGDHVRILPGVKIPADGEVTEGWSSLDESMLTGEPLPVEESTGSKVSAGTLNTSGSFVMRVTRIGSETALSQIIQMVAQAQRSQAPIQQLADRVAAVFVPVVLFISLLTFVLWMLLGSEPRFFHALTGAVSVLMIACPCALGLATPMALTVGIARSARHGILVRSATALQNLATASLLALDKTGTLTEGMPRVVAIHPAGTFSKETLLKLTAGAERGSEHPLARAVVRHADEVGITVPNASLFESHPGGGISATVEGKALLVGSLHFLNDRGVVTEALAPFFSSEGEGMVAVSCDGAAAGVVLFRDVIRSSASTLLAELQLLGLRVVMLTGDRESTAHAVASKLGLTEYHSGMSPRRKAAQLLHWKQEGLITAMAGDGINDAPALAAADASIAMGAGSDIAKESAGIILLRPSLEGIVTSIKLSRAILKIIRQNLFFAFAYNIVGIPIAAGVLYPWFGILLSPMLAAAAMSLSSVSVIANSLRLRKLGSAC